LAKTRNRAVLPLLARALQSDSAAKRAATIRCLVRRHDRESHRQLIGQFAKLRAADREVLFDAHRTMPHHMAASLKAAVLRGDAEFCDAACQIILRSGDFELFSALVQAVENRQHRFLSTVLAAVSQMAAALHRELSLQSKRLAKPRRDPTFVRRNVLATLEGSLTRYASHERQEIIDAYLLLAPCDHSPMLRILNERQHPCHSAIADSLANSPMHGILEKLIDILRNTDAPLAALEALARRNDREFVRSLLANIKHPVPLRVVHNMKRLTAVAWLEEHCEVLVELDGRSQAVAVELATASSIGESSLFSLLALMMKSGLAEGRRASCTALARFRGAQADSLVRSALDDPDAGVQAAAVRQLRQRGLPDALRLLVSLLDSRSIEVRDAARSSLAEFNFVRYRAMFDLLDEKAVRTTGVLVHKVDHGVRDGLMQELRAPSMSSRLRGIEMAVAMDATQDVSDQLIELTRSDSVTIRQEAVAALGSCSGPRVQSALRLAAGDISQSVRDAATASLERLANADDQATQTLALAAD
jgi:HEAT repeat protein